MYTAIPIPCLSPAEPDAVTCENSGPVVVGPKRAIVRRRYPRASPGSSVGHLRHGRVGDRRSRYARIGSGGRRCPRQHALASDRAGLAHRNPHALSSICTSPQSGAASPHRCPRRQSRAARFCGLPRWRPAPHHRPTALTPGTTPGSRGSRRRWNRPERGLPACTPDGTAPRAAPGTARASAARCGAHRVAPPAPSLRKMRAHCPPGRAQLEADAPSCATTGSEPSRAPETGRRGAETRPTPTTSINDKQFRLVTTHALTQEGLFVEPIEKLHEIILRRIISCSQMVCQLPPVSPAPAQSDN